MRDLTPAAVALNCPLPFGGTRNAADGGDESLAADGGDDRDDGESPQQADDGVNP